MALIVFLKGVNVGGHRTFRPSALAKALSRFDVVNVGAAGTFVVRKPVEVADMRAQLARHLPFEADVMICTGRELLGLIGSAPFARQRADPRVVQFVSVLASRRRSSGAIPLDIPEQGDWGLRILGQRGRFVFGLYRREMKAIGYLARVETLFGVAATTRSWSTMLAVERVLTGAADR
jgi:uncharacterized protein (DUF1697 family)